MSELAKIFTGEFLGTMFLILLGNGVVMNVVLRGTKGNKAGWVVITMGWGFAVFLGVIVANLFGTGGHLNPAVTMAQWAQGKFDGSAAKPFIFLSGQIVGAFVGQFLANFAYRHHIQKSDPQSVLGCHATGPTDQSKKINNLVTEMIGTAVLVTVALGIATSYGAGSKPIMQQIMNFAGPLTMGFVVMSIGMSIGGPTGYAINPARDLIPRIAYVVYYKLFSKDAIVSQNVNANWSYAWIPVLGPLMAGTFVGLMFRAAGVK